jgi:PucR C-terminal helix-turn-helix domain
VLSLSQLPARHNVCTAEGGGDDRRRSHARRAEPFGLDLTRLHQVALAAASERLPDTEAAKRLHVAVRTVTYRLDRVRQLTGYDAANPIHRFTLQAAVLGARVLGWPEAPLPGPEG